MTSVSASAERSVFGWMNAVPILAFLAAWQIVAAASLVPPVFLPAPTQVLARMAHEIAFGDFLWQFEQTAIRLFGGFGIAFVVGVTLGLAAATSRVGRAILLPTVRVFSPIPKIALYPALMLTLGYGHESKIALVVLDVLFPIMLSTFQGACEVEPKLVWSALAAGTSRRAIPFRIILPSALPTIVTGCRIGAVIACVSVFLAEMISSTTGLGHVLIMAARSYRVVDMFAPLVAISVTGLVLNLLIGSLETKFRSA